MKQGCKVETIFEKYDVWLRTWRSYFVGRVPQPRRVCWRSTKDGLSMTSVTILGMKSKKGKKKYFNFLFSWRCVRYILCRYPDRPPIEPRARARSLTGPADVDTAGVTGPVVHVSYGYHADHLPVRLATRSRPAPPTQARATRRTGSRDPDPMSRHHWQAGSRSE